ncbi:Protein farnesyltransferase subunit beta [Mycena venus]|uniref:Protein farnesyltransferase subunit beta n=1 Tax=Mycena venus TaxID=2733690 RepID=A0A8H6WUR8_9AGAR|nr:Protein farnesyltransferase subunit beta [Mycena venus]
MSSSTTMRPSPIDSFPTPTSSAQAETEKILLEHLPVGDNTAAPTLQKNAHMQYLIRNIVQGFPARYTSQDASQPWLMFWTLQAFSVLQVGLDPGNKQKAVETIMAWQHPEGGFGGGPHQAAHLLPTYAAVCALAIAGKPGEGGGWDQIDRKKMYKFFMSLKQPDGSFLVAHHSEVDVRGIYCLLVTATLLDIITSELVEGTASFIASLQTYEGGFSSASQPYYTPSSSAGGPSILLETPRPPLGEAHGGYTFCALASWVMLLPFLPSSSSASQPKINKNSLLRWLVQMQGVPAELGGFKGRTNKLVDGCYSWWVGGAFALLESIGINPAAVVPGAGAPTAEKQDGDDWDDIDDSLMNRKALQEYILFAGQHPAGGLRDKPPKHADAYHTLSCLAGLSSAQHKVFPSPARRKELLDSWQATANSTNEDGLRKRVFTDALCYTEEEGTETIVGGAPNRVNATHPLFNLTITHTEGMMAHFYKQTVPPRVFKRATAGKP